MIKPKEEISPYDRAIELNKELGLKPCCGRYSVAGEGFYGLYDNFDKLSEDLAELGYTGKKIWKVATTEPDKHTYKAYNAVFKNFLEKNGGTVVHHQIIPITKENSNTIIFPEKLKLFSHV